VLVFRRPPVGTPANTTVDAWPGLALFAKFELSDLPQNEAEPDWGTDIIQSKSKV
jgi:hypothetical protein